MVMEFSSGDSSITVRPAPVRDPPFDDELDSDALEPPNPMQPALPFPPMHPPVRHRPAMVARSARRVAAGDPSVAARRLLIGVIEVAARRRPLSQLTPLVTARVAFRLRQSLTPIPGRPDNHRLRNAVVSSMRSSEPADGVAEISATLRTPTRAHAAAIRLEILRGQWICTQLITA